jgi:hypothetical protein
MTDEVATGDRRARLVRAISANAVCMALGAVGIFVSGGAFNSEPEPWATRAVKAGLVLLLSAPLFGSIAARATPRWLLIVACAVEGAAALVVLAWFVSTLG